MDGVTVKTLIFLLFLTLSALALFTGGRGILKQDRERENKWAEYEHRGRRRNSWEDDI